MKRLAVLISLFSSTALAADVRDFAPDRPSRSDSPYTVPTGLFELESDFVSFSQPDNVFQALDPALRLGITSRAEIDAQIGGLITQETADGRKFSFGDVVVRAKVSLLGDDGGPVAIAIIPYLKIPTARDPIGNGAVEGGINMPILITLPLNFGLTVEPEVAALKDADSTRHNFSATGIVNLGRKIYGNLSGFVEIFDQGFTDPHAPGPSVTLDVGLAYLLTETLQIDIGSNIGLNRATPGFTVYSGIAKRF